MKNLILLSLVIVFSLSANGQSSGDFDLFQSVFGAEKKFIVNEFIPLEGEKSTTFWEIYNAYEADKKDLGKEKLSLLESYIDQYYDIDDERASDLMNQALSLRKQELKILSKYYKKMNKGCGGKIAAQFYQIENYFNNTMALTITESIPFVGELD